MVYRTLVDEMRRCMQTGMITGTVIVHGDIFTDIKKAVVTPTLHSGLGAAPLLIVDIVAIADDTTRVDVMHPRNAAADAKVLQGVSGGTPMCSRE